MITQLILNMFSGLINGVTAALNALIPAPPSWITTDLSPIESGMNYLGGFVCWPALAGAAAVVLSFRVGVVLYHLTLRLISLFTLGGVSR